MNKSEEAMYYTVGTSAARNKPEKLKLNTLNFALGIRAREINENFDLLRYWIEAERLRVGGWGIVEGFNMTKDLEHYTIHVDAGVIINEYGEEIHVPATDPPLFAGAPEPDKIIMEHTVNEYGVIELDYPVYSDIMQHTVTWRPPTEMDDRFATELSVRIKDTGQELLLGRDIQNIEENIIVLTSNHAGRTVEVEYWYANDRIDGIFLSHDGTDYKYQHGIISTSPSEQVVQDYFDRGYYLIGFAYWHVGREIDVEFFTGDRTLRRVFVDKNNILYLNGKPYREKTVIYFVEPDPPTENDLWYDTVTEILYIWRPNDNGIYEWQPVNDLARSATEVYQFREAENPDDLQTFDFFAHPQLFFAPGKHQLTIIIDQVVIMEDQYEELYYGQKELENIKQRREEYEEQYAQLQKNLSGYGIRFKYPLERPSVVEIRVNRALNTRQHGEDAFQHESLYGQGGTLTVEDGSVDTYSINCQFQCFQNQIEVYRNGIRLDEGVHYAGLLKNQGEAVATIANRFDRDNECAKIKFFLPLQIDDKISYRILRPIATYANLQSILEEHTRTANECMEAVRNITASINDFEEDVSETIREYDGIISNQSITIATLQSSKVDRTDKLTADHLADEISSNLVMGKIRQSLTISGNQLFVFGISSHDFLVLGYQSSRDTSVRLLMEDIDYTIQDTADGANILLEPEWMGDASARLHIIGLKLGAESNG